MKRAAEFVTGFVLYALIGAALAVICADVIGNVATAIGSRL